MVITAPYLKYFTINDFSEFLTFACCLRRQHRIHFSSIDHVLFVHENKNKFDKTDAQ